MPMKRSPESPHSNEQYNINQIRKVIREQTTLHLKGKNAQNRPMVPSYNSDDSDDLEVPVRKFTPLPDIPRADNPYYRTESKLIKNEIDNDDDDEVERPHGALPLKNIHNNSTPIVNSFENHHTESTHRIQEKPNLNMETRLNHFASNPKPKAQIHRLPALEKHLNHGLHQTMDLDEDLPLNPINTTNVRNQRMTYTSPGDRIISPIKRPQAPSPPASSINRRKEHSNSDSDSDDSL